LKTGNRVFGTKRGGGVTGGREEFYNDFHNLYSEINIIRLHKSRTISWTGDVARIEGMENLCRILVGKFERRDFLLYPGVDKSIILN
jgi:hypothetical protein